MYKYLLSFSLAVATLLGTAQGEMYRVYFTDKGEQLALLDQPERFLSGKAIWRRAKQNIAIDETDLPVSRNYLGALKGKVEEIRMHSKWLNYAVVKGGAIEQLTDLPFVKKVEAVVPLVPLFSDAGCAAQAINYGQATVQIEMLRGHELHGFGFTGAGMVIAVIDGGFSGALPTTPGFDSLYTRGQILGSYDFIQNDTDVFDVGSHGATVLSVMGGYKENEIAGSAPDASFWLLKSENELQETTVEMDNWVRAAEFADSVGADVINSSLGYTTFDGGIGNLAQSDMDGNTAVVTIGADMAAQKGILVVASAGNSGTSSWPIIGAPGDGDSVLTVGGVDGNKDYVAFSSRGPTADGRIKPDVVAMAQSTTTLGFNGVVRNSNGTSFSSPLIAGLAACLWQYNPSLSNMEIYRAIKHSASHYYTPNFNVGFGIPNFALAAYNINLAEEEVAALELELFPNPVKENIRFRIKGLSADVVAKLQVLDLSGRVVYAEEVYISETAPNTIKAPSAKGVYLFTVTNREWHFVQELVVE